MASGSGETTSVGEVVEFVRTYAKQETVGPLKGAGTWLIWSVVGSLLLAVASVFLLLGLLRMLQTEIFDGGGAWSFVPYILVAIVCVVGVLLTRNLIDKNYLYKEEQS